MLTAVAYSVLKLAELAFGLGTVLGAGSRVKLAFWSQLLASELLTQTEAACLGTVAAKVVPASETLLAMALAVEEAARRQSDALTAKVAA